MNRKPPIPLKTCSVSSLAPTSDRWPHGLILMSPPRCAPCSPARQDHNPHQALPEHCTHSYLRRNDDVVCHCSLLGDGLDEYLPHFPPNLLKSLDFGFEKSVIRKLQSIDFKGLIKMTEPWVTKNVRQLKNSRLCITSICKRPRAKSTSLRHHSRHPYQPSFRRRSYYEPTHSTAFSRPTHGL